MNEPTFTSFLNDTLLASGNLRTVLGAVKQLPADAGPALIFDDSTGKEIDFDLSQSVDELVAAAGCEPARTGPGRPKLGVVPREVTLLPAHWDWLADQRGGASATLRRLVDQARSNETTEQLRRRTAAATGRIMTSLAGDLPGFEEASRALYKGDLASFQVQISDWPKDIRCHLTRVSIAAFKEG